MNLATKAPNFTPETAKFMAARSLASRRLNAQREKEAFEAGRIAALKAQPNDDEARRKTTLAQLDALDKRLDAALDDEDDERFMKLAAIKAKLWALVQPTAGVMKPASRRTSNRPTVEPIADAGPQATI